MYPVQILLRMNKKYNIHTYSIFVMLWIRVSFQSPINFWMFIYCVGLAMLYRRPYSGER